MIKDKHNLKTWLFFSIGSLLFIAVIFLIYHLFFSSVKLGFSAGLSGLKSELGISGRNGAQLAVEEINRNGGIRGRKLELLVMDDKNDARIACAVDQSLAKQGVNIIIGHMVSSVATDTVKNANENKVLLISPTIAMEELTYIDDNFIRVIASNKVQGYSLAKAVLRETPVRSIAIVYDENNASFAKIINESFEMQMRDSGGSVVANASFKNRSDFKSIISVLRESNADGVLLIASAIDAGMFCQQSRKQNLKLPVFSPMWTMTNDFIQAGGADVEGAYLISQVDLESEAAVYVEFKKAYQDRYGESPSFASILSYDAVMVATAAIQEAGTDSTAQVKDAILRIGEFSGLQGPIKMDEFGDVKNSYYLYRVQNGVFKKVGRL